jgi:hypothetical protein
MNVFWFSQGDFRSDTACLKLNIKTESVVYFINLQPTTLKTCPYISLLLKSKTAFPLKLVALGT